MNRAPIIAAWLFIVGSLTFALFHLIGSAKARSDASAVELYRDMATGCEYVTTSHDGALTPRIATDGLSHMGCKGVLK